MKKIYDLIKKYSILLFSVYLAFLVVVIILKFPTGLVSGTIKSWMNGGTFYRMTPQFVPFKTIIEYVGMVQSIHDWFFKNLACNLIMFMPYGFLLPFMIQRKKRTGIKVVLSGCIASAAIEVFQYMTALGLCDIDDVILNTMGVALGYGIYKIIDIFQKKRSSED